MVSFLRSIFIAANHRLKKTWWRINRHLRKSMKITTKQGVFFISLETNDALGKYLYMHGEHELDFMLDVIKFLRNEKRIPEKGKGVLLDIGANIGITSIGFLSKGEFQSAIAIEPEPRNFRLLQKNTELNKLNDKIICLPYAASDISGSIALELSPNNSGDHRARKGDDVSKAPELHAESKRQVIKVRTEKIDNLLKNISNNIQEKITMAWVDTQGHEGYVFCGAKGLLSRDIPIVSELWPYGILRSGMTREDYVSIVSDIWTSYWIRKSEGIFVKYPIAAIGTFFDELCHNGAFDNVIFTK